MLIYFCVTEEDGTPYITLSDFTITEIAMDADTFSQENFKSCYEEIKRTITLKGHFVYDSEEYEHATKLMDWAILPNGDLRCYKKMHLEISNNGLGEETKKLLLREETFENAYITEYSELFDYQAGLPLFSVTIKNLDKKLSELIPIDKEENSDNNVEEEEKPKEEQLPQPPVDSNTIFVLASNLSSNDNINKAMDLMCQYYNNDSQVKQYVDGGETCLFGFEGLGIYNGNGNKYHPDGFYGAIMLVTKGKTITYITQRASTLPDAAFANIATLKEGIYQYNGGLHNMSKKNIAYPALRHDALSKVPCWYGQSDKTFKDGIGRGINIHTAGESRNLTRSWSEGCQTVYYADYVDFGKAVGFLKSNAPNISNGNAPELNNKGNPEVYLANIKVLYILDRSQLPENQKGIFTPE